MELKLSILIPSVHTRRNTFLPKSLEMLYGQLEKLTEEQQQQVEILFLVDNKTQYLGQKRNYLVDIAQGEYVVFVDDDDRITEDYISTLLQATTQGSDCICFQAEVSINKEAPKICDYSIKHLKDSNTPNGYLRIPNHICAIKKSIAQQVSFPNKVYGEDSAFSSGLLPLLQTETRIDRVLYYYDFNTETTETQKELHQKQQSQRKYEVDVVILSNAKTPELRAMTQETIRTCLENSGSTNIRITVIEQNPRVFYRGARVHQPRNPEVFNYNERADQGIQSSDAKYVVVANNDLLFRENWLQELLQAKYPVVSPVCPKDPRHKGILKNEKGSKCGRNFSGFCFMIERELWNKLPQEQLQKFPFFYADNVVVQELLKLGIEPVVVPTSKVQHLGSTTLKTLPEQEQQEAMWAQTELFNTSYNQNLFEEHSEYIRWKSSRTQK